MTTIIARPARLLYPVITRESISWRTVSPGIVEIAIDLENPESEPTSPGDLVIETAALGAFVPFRPVTRIAVGSLEPGGRRRVTERVMREVLAASPALAGNPGAFMAEIARRANLGVKPEVLDLLAHSQWAGNLNVYFDRRPEQSVEVHRALDLQVKAAQPVFLMVALPSNPAEYGTDILVSDPGWRAEVVDLFDAPHVIVHPPASAGSRAQVTIEVTRRSDGRCVPVELSLETVTGAGGTLGCIGV